MAEEERKGHLKVTIDVEINEDLMEVMEENIQEIPKKVKGRLEKS